VDEGHAADALGTHAEGADSVNDDDDDDDAPPAFVPPPFACEDGETIRRRIREIKRDQEIAECDARADRSREAPAAKFSTGFMVYQGPPA
jgi:hypothetical protein